ncbi:MAG: protein BatD [Magnetococcales bacterium]|nr:protein BatD [Magnetococcales bacterium]
MVTPLDIPPQNQTRPPSTPRNGCHIRQILGALWVFIAVLPGASWAAEVRAWTDRNPVAIDQSFQLTFEVENGAGGAPDFSPMEQDFDILSRNQSSSFQFINGQQSRKESWHLTLMAKRVGSLIIPAIRFGNIQSQPAKITITKGKPALQSQSGAPFFLEVASNRTSATVQSQIIYTVRFFRHIDIASAQIDDPKPSGVESVVEKLSEDRAYRTQRHGRNYLVVERNYAIFPQKSGQLILEPLLLEVRSASRRGGFFSGMLNHPLFNQNAPVQRLRSKALTIEVTPIPASFGGPRWLPAHNLQLVEKWSEDPAGFKVGEPITRTVTLMADGLSASQLPEITGTAPKGVKSYPDQPHLKDQKEATGIIGLRREKSAIIPTHAGDFQLPAIEIPWWDVDENVMKTARIPARSLHTAPQPDAQHQAPQQRQIQPSPQQATTPAPSPTMAPETQLAPMMQQHASDVWPWVALFLGVGWAGTALAWLLQTRNAPKPAEPDASSPALSLETIRSKLKRACFDQDAQAVRHWLPQWGAIIWNEAAPTPLDELERRGGQVLNEEMQRLNQSLYGSKGEKPWDGNRLWQAIEKHRPIRDNKSPEQLAPLYPP